MRFSAKSSVQLKLRNPEPRIGSNNLTIFSIPILIHVLYYFYVNVLKTAIFETYWLYRNNCSALNSISRGNILDRSFCDTGVKVSRLEF